MAAAVIALREKILVETHNVPRTTFLRLSKENEVSLQDILTKEIDCIPVFNRVLYAVIRMDMRRIAYQLAFRNNVLHPIHDERA